MTCSLLIFGANALDNSSSLFNQYFFPPECHLVTHQISFVSFNVYFFTNLCDISRAI